MKWKNAIICMLIVVFITLSGVWAGETLPKDQESKITISKLATISPILEKGGGGGGRGGGSSKSSSATKSTSTTKTHADADDDNPTTTSSTTNQGIGSYFMSFLVIAVIGVVGGLGCLWYFFIRKR